MSAETTQQRLDGAKPPKPHLAAESSAATASGLTADHDREWYCGVCGARITIGTDGETEYGHRTLSGSGEHCPHRLSWGEDDE